MHPPTEKKNPDFSGRGYNFLWEKYLPYSANTALQVSNTLAVLIKYFYLGRRRAYFLESANIFLTELPVSVDEGGLPLLGTLILGVRISPETPNTILLTSSRIIHYSGGFSDDSFFPRKGTLFRIRLHRTGLNHISRLVPRLSRTSFLWNSCGLEPYLIKVAAPVEAIAHLRKKEYVTRAEAVTC